ncbi:NAD(P)-binding protein [Conidiobolus coronatus NRRL 28638]|uniref:NAD(P)-binding protein n=1 Tax=Conidiobolus coronatus (strain ATCC 28846 / CBS 209.66 / NRRL 28638) TaxID=796925 RepID=A0A137P3W9_CONC2|nr:NAD(P)-binding protein [Conidiobolus coronatus NRRL 28638]|eukprot:KXN69706.1 NAD(P)-binding protein [Conidiobolus coronatus NRRL 28638]
MVQTVVISGASGLLGRAVYATFKKHGVNTIGLAHSRVSGDLVKLDLTNQSQVEEFFEKTKPSVFIHCAAERRPDVSENDKTHTDNLNIQVPEFLAKMSAKHNSELIYMCSDSLFDGKNPPYDVDSEINPINYYGKSKLGGERAIHRVYPRAISVRLPVLYGDVEYPEETSINILVSIVKNTSVKKAVDDWGVRVPTNVEDIAECLYQVTEKLKEKSSNFPNIIHLSAHKTLTKYDMCKIFGKILNINIDHIEPLTDVPIDSAAPRPKDCHLATGKTEALGISPCSTDFETWFKHHLEAKGDMY